MGRTKEDLIQEAADKEEKALKEAYERFGIDPNSPAPQDQAGASPAPEGDQAAAPGQDPASPDNSAQAAPLPAQDKQPAPAQQDLNVPAPSAGPSQSEVSQLQQNYDNLRSWSDRVQTRNTELMRENEELKRQIQVLSMARPPQEAQPRDVQPQAAPAAGTAQPGDGGVAATTSSQGENYADAIKTLDALAVEYPDSIAPLVNVLKGVVSDLGAVKGRVDPAIDLIVKDEQTRAQTAEEAKLKAVHDKISEGVPNWQNLVYVDPNIPYTTEGEPALSPQFQAWLDQHPAGYDYFRLLFPEQPGMGATPGMTVRILKEFSESPFATPLHEKMTTSRMAAAGADVQGEQRPKGFVPNNQANTSVDPVERLKAGGSITRQECNQIMSTLKDAVSWASMGPLLDKAQAEGRIVDPTINRDLYFRTSVSG